MDRFKQFVLRQFEKILVLIILIATFLGTYYIEDKSIVLNFYYLPVLVAGYFLGRRMGILAAIFSILIVFLFILNFPQHFLIDKIFWYSFAKLSSWGGFLILASITVGTLYEKKELQMRDLKNAYIGILEILSKYLESTDPYTKGHSVRVSELAKDTAITMDLPLSDIENLRVAGLLHDIGKIEISGDILRKAAELSTEEKEIMDSHAVKGAYLLTSVGSVLKEVVPIVVAHHKYFVDTLENEKDTKKIPLAARIIAVADSFDAMTTDRPYRKGKPPWEALDEIVSNAGKQFDPEVVAAFKHVVSSQLERV